MSRHAWVLLLLLTGCPDRTLEDTETGGDPATSTGEPASTTGEPTTVAPTTDDVTGEPTTGEPTTGDPTTGEPDACVDPPAPQLLWSEISKHTSDADGSLGRGLAVDDLGRIYHAVLQGPPGGELLVHRRALDGSGASVTALANPTGQNTRALAVTADGSRVYVALETRLLAVEDGAVVWEHDTGGAVYLGQVLVDPNGGAVLRAFFGQLPMVQSLDDAGALRWSFVADDGDKDTGDTSRGLTWTADGRLVLVQSSWSDDLGQHILLHAFDAGDGAVLWRKRHPADDAIAYGSIAAAEDGALYVAGTEGFDPRKGVLRRLGADGELVWSKTFLDDVILERAPEVLALPGGDALVSEVSVPRAFRFDAAGELVREIDIDDLLAPRLALSLRLDPCGGAVFLHQSSHVFIDDETYDAYSLGRLWP